MKNWLLYSALIIFAVLALLDWQQANLSQELVMRDATIANLKVSLEQVKNKSPDILTIEIEKTIFVSRPVAILASGQIIDLDYLLEKIEQGIYNHQYYVLNPDKQVLSLTGDTAFNQEWVETYRQLQSLLLEIKGNNFDNSLWMPPRMPPPPSSPPKPLLTKERQ